jgi:hypothetical protein
MLTSLSGDRICVRRLSTGAPIRIELRWSKYAKLTAARAAFPHEACVYVQADRSGRPVRVGKASKGLDERYHGGNGYSLDAAMHQSGNLVFVAPVEAVKSQRCWKIDRGRTRFRGAEIATPIAIVDPDATAARALRTAPTHFRSFCTTGGVGRLTAGATR